MAIRIVGRPTGLLRRPPNNPTFWAKVIATADTEDSVAIDLPSDAGYCSIDALSARAGKVARRVGCRAHIRKTEDGYRIWLVKKRRR
jgi:hypothetical protein